MLLEALKELLEDLNLGRDRRHLALEGIQRRRKVRHSGRIVLEDSWNNRRKAATKVAVGRKEGRKEGKTDESFGNIPTCIPHESEKGGRLLQFFPKW